MHTHVQNAKVTNNACQLMTSCLDRSGSTAHSRYAAMHYINLLWTLACTDIEADIYHIV